MRPATGVQNVGRASKVTKDLLYDRDNKHLDIARLSALLSVVAYIVGTGYALVTGMWEFDPAQWGIGWATTCGGNAAWIYARQRYEAKIAFSMTEKGPSDQGDFGFEYAGRGGYRPYMSRSENDIV